MSDGNSGLRERPLVGGGITRLGSIEWRRLRARDGRSCDLAQQAGKALNESEGGSNISYRRESRCAPDKASRLSSYVC